MGDKINILDVFMNSEAIILTKEEMNDPTIPKPITSTSELWDRYREFISASGAYDQYDNPLDDGETPATIQGIYLKPGTSAAERLKARGKKYPTFKATRDYEKWRNKNIKQKEN